MHLPYYYNILTLYCGSLIVKRGLLIEHPICSFISKGISHFRLLLSFFPKSHSIFGIKIILLPWILPSLK